MRIGAADREATEAPWGNPARAVSNHAVPTAGWWLMAASVLMIAVLLLHGPIAPDPAEQMTKISSAADRWRLAHWLAAASLSSYAVTGLLVLTAGSRLAPSVATLSAWAVVVVGAIWTLTTAVAEATTVTMAAIGGARETFDAWWAFAEGKATGFAFVALALAVVATHDARIPERVTPAWSARFGAAAGVASFAGWALGMWLGVRPGNLVWVVSSVLLSVWTLAYGAGLRRRYAAR